jgi:hypothetical protein
MLREKLKRLPHTPKHDAQARKRDVVDEFLDVLARLIAVHHLRVTRDEVKPSGPKRRVRKKQTVD